MDYLKEDTTISYFIVQDTDRLARDEHDHFVIRDYLKRLGVRLISMNQPGINDSAEGQFMDTIIAGVNAFQSRMTGRKVSTIMERMAAQGKTTDPAPLGYINVNRGTEEKPIRVVEFHPQYAPLVKEAFELYGTSFYSIADIVRILTEKGLLTMKGNKLCSSTMAKILANPYYAGKIYYKGKTYPNGQTSAPD